MNGQPFIQSLLISVLTAVIAENFVFARAFGVSTVIVSAQNKRNLSGICMGVCCLTAAASAVTWAVTGLIPSDGGAAQYLPLIYALIIGLVYLLTLLAAFVFIRSRFDRIKKYIHISAFNSTVMGTIFLSSVKCSGFGEYIMFGMCAGAGFTAAAYMLSAVYPRLYSPNVPHAFRGYPAVMLFAGIMAMAVYGILGHAPSYI